MTTTPSEPADIETEARRLRQQMVDTMRANGWITSDRVAAAMNRVPRQDFAPDTDLRTVYQAESVVRFGFDANGVCVTSMSAPRCQAEMLEFAHVQVGDTVLEVGSGGVNAAYLAELTGPGGHVVSVDIDPEVTDRASRCLDRAGYSRVTVALADAEYGMPEHAPYDTILVTAGVWDIPPAWGDQLAEHGRLVVPLRFQGLTRVVVFVPDGPRLSSIGHETYGFVSLRGEGEHSGLVVSAGSGMNLVFDEDEPVEPQALAGVLNGPPTEVWSSATVPSMVPFDLLQLFLATTLPGIGKLVPDPDHRGDKPLTRAVMGPVTSQARSAAFLTCRKTSLVDERGRALWEFGAIGYGPQAQDVAEQMAEQIREWDRSYRGTSPQILVYPATTPDEQITGDKVIEKRHTKVAFAWKPATRVPVQDVPETHAKHTRQPLPPIVDSGIAP